jgi:heme O synthase-like polyprenyltransferase
LPAGRLRVTEASVVAVATGLLGLMILAWLPSGPLACLIAAASLILYVMAYTPAKRWTVWNTLIGAVPGALPPLIGWSAATGSLSRGAFPLFAVLFFWQVPHFLAIAWIYRDHIGPAGLKMLPVNDTNGSRTVGVMVVSSLLLMVASYWPLLEGGRLVLWSGGHWNQWVILGRRESILPQSAGPRSSNCFESIDRLPAGRAFVCGFGSIHRLIPTSAIEA